MAALCMGNFGCYKIQYNLLNQRENTNRIDYQPREQGLYRIDFAPKPPTGAENAKKFQEEQLGNIYGSEEVVWVRKRYTPLDPRDVAPAARFKWMAGPNQPAAPSHWVQAGEPSPLRYFRGPEEKEIYASQPSSRSEEWSTLRQLLPSTGRSIGRHPSNWGSGYTLPPLMTSVKQRRFPHVNSPMTRYQDDMHLTNRLFRLH